MSAVGYGKFCQALLDGDEDARVLLAYHHLFLRTGKFDPLTGEGLPTDLDALLTGIACFSREKPRLDRLCRLEAHCGAALLQLLKTPHESLRREYAMLPLHSVREMDAHTVAWLGRQPGKTLAQKLAGKRSMKAIRRRWVLDSAENRLLKAFVRTFAETIEVHGRALGFDPEEESAEWQKAARRWLGSVEVEEIGNWSNTPPNNVLLSHKQYRKIWDAWCWLLEFDREITLDFENIRSIALELLFWRMAARLHESEDFRLLQSVCFFRVPRFRFGMSLATDDLDIRGRCRQGDAWRDLRLALTNGVLRFSIGGNEIFHAGLKNGRMEVDHGGTTKPLDTLEDITRVCSLPETTPDTIAEGTVGALDCCKLEPFFRLDEGIPSRLPFRLLAQENAQPPLLLDCGNAKALRIGTGQSLFSFHDIFLGTGGQLPQRASFLFKRVRKFLHCRHLHLVTPDNIDEFRLGAVNRRACAAFPSAQTIPRSIGAIFSILKKDPDIFADYDRLGVVVCYFYGNNFLLTLLRGKKSPFLESNVPKCGGFVWERFPTWAVPWHDGLEAVQKNREHKVLKLSGRPPLELASLAGGVSFFHTGRDESLAAFELETDLGTAVREAASKVAIPQDVWEKATAPATAEGYPLFLLLSDSQIRVSGIRPSKIYGPADALHGAAALARWQRKWPEAEFWKEHLPDLLMRASSDGRRKFWSLVKNVSIRATPGAVKEIHLEDKEIELPASGNDAYYFPLKREEGGNYLSYVAKLASRFFPLSAPVKFRLRLRYAYGAENPYTLEFIPADDAFPEKLTVQWLPEENVPKNSPAPAFPGVDDWASQEYFTGKYGPENLVKKFSEGFVRNIHKKVFFHKKDPQARRVYWPDFGPDTEWIRDSFCFFETSDRRSVLVHKSNFYDRDGTPKCPVKQGGISFDIEENRNQPGKFFARRVTPGFSFPPLVDDDLDEEALRNQNKRKATLRFHAQHLWNYGRSLSDADAPPVLRQTTVQFIEDVQWLIKMNLLTKAEFSVCEDIFARMHRDAPKWIWKFLERGIDEHNLGRILNIGYALGDLRLDDQRRLLSRLLDAVAGDCNAEEKFAFGALSIALWRARVFVNRLSREQLAGLADNLLKYFRNLLDVLDRRGHAMSPNELKKFDRDFQQICEILLALLRSRGFDDDETKKLLDANGELAKHFMEEIERLIAAQETYDFKMKSFVELKIDKSESWKMPDILFAVDKYLSGDESSADIRIISLSDEM